MQHRLLAADHQRVTGIVPALEARDRTHLLGQQIDDLALAFITPLRTEYNNRLAHGLPQIGPVRG